MSLWGAIGAAALGAGAQLITGSQAARAQEKSANQATGLQRDIYQQNRTDLEPYRKVGTEALGNLADIYLRGKKDFTASPGYDFRVEEGIKARDRSAAARGLLLSGPQQKALERFGQGMAADEYERGFNRLAALAGIGQTATGAGISAGQTFAGNAGNAIMAGGAARASGYENTGNAITSGINNAVSLYGLGRAAGWF